MGDPGRPFDEVELAAWHGLLRTHALVIRRLDEALISSHGLSVSEFDVLITLDNAPDRELRMTDLAAAVMLSPSGLTRLVTRLERAGLVDRTPATGDGRSYLARLTSSGADLLSSARSTHNAVIRELMLDRLSHAERTGLGRAWRRVHAG